jgi:hypothetical protein
LHLTAVDDTHAVGVHSLPPTRPRTLQSETPEPWPSTVTLAEPVEAPFEDTVLLGEGRDRSKLTDSERLPA